MNTFFSFILVLGLLIFVHELGHFLFAKLFGVRVLKFSLGFGPKIASKVIGETEYVLSALPLGGYVKMFGENPDEQNVSSVDRKASFAHKKVWQRFSIVFAGPLFNLLFCLVLFWMVFFFAGLPTSVDSTRIGKVSDNSPAQRAGIIAEDVIIEIDNRPTTSWLDVLDGVKGSDGKQISLVVLRQNEEIEISVIPEIDSVKDQFGEEIDRRFMIGIMKAEELIYTDISLVESVKYACAQTWAYISITALGFIKIFQAKIPASELGGPILIAQIAGQQMQAGWLNLISFMGLLSVNLGLLNLLPIPVLDGGHLVFLTLEAIMRKPMNERVQIVAQQVGIGLLGTLMIFVFYNDIVRLFS